jgi:arylsulfatase A-like enzyme
MSKIILFNSKTWAAAGTLVLFLPVSRASTMEQDKNPPNIILIVSDDQGYNDIGIYGGSEILTPNLDELARKGIRFTNFYVTAAACTPSRSSLLTGRYPQRNGTYELFRNNRVNDGHRYTTYEYSVSPERVLGMDLKEILISDLLKDAGYVNGIFGKWDLGQLKRHLPLQRGFDQFYGFTNTGIDYYTHERYGVPSMYRDNEPTIEDKGTWCDLLFEREALRFVRENHGNPFFLYLPFFAPHVHSNFDPDRRGTFPAPQDYLDLYPEPNSQQESRRAGYMAAVTLMDNAIGNILGLVDSLGLRDNTIIIFLSDNGGQTNIANNHPLSGGKATMREGGLRVPMIISWPGKIGKEQVADNFLSSLEIFPTILSVAGINKPAGLVLDGFNIMPLLTGEDNLERQEMYWEFREEYAARVGNFKWIKSDRGNEGGLFDLSVDIPEDNDLKEQLPDELSRIETKFNQWQKEMIEAEPRGPFRNF